MVSVIYSDEFLDHNTGSFHPECAGRLTAIINALQAEDWAEQIHWQLPQSIAGTGAEVALVQRISALQDWRYVEAVKALAARGGGQIDADTIVSSRSYDVALLAVQAWLDGVNLVLASGEPVFVAARPPGHHATSRRGMGFCLFSNGAIAAHYALEKPGIERVAILDWDVHHGNGTQDIVEKHAQIAYCSLHQFPHYPGTGRADETGQFGNILNIPMAAGSVLSDYLSAFEGQVMPFLRQFDPDFLIISAGYDAAQADPLAEIALQPEDYGILMEQCLGLTRRILLGLEGGYDFEALGRAVVATLAAAFA